MKCRKRVIELLEDLDFFSTSPAFLFTFKNKFHYSTISTKIMTLFISFLTFGSFFYFASNFITSSNPQNILIEEYDINPDKLLMGDNSFFFTFALENSTDNYRPFFDESIYKVDAMIETRINETMYKTNISVGKCEINNIPENARLLEYFKYYNRMYCFKNNSEAIMNGTWDSEIFKGIRLEIRPCINQTDGDICQSNEIIKKYLDGYFTMYYSSVQTNLNNYETPLLLSAIDDFKPISSKQSSQIYLYFGRIQVETDIGVFSEKLIYHEGVKLSTNNYIPMIDDSDTSVLTVFLRLDGVTKLTKRKYDKVLDVISKVGGLMRFLTVIGTLFLKPFLEAAMLQRVSNETFDYEELLKDEPENFGDKANSTRKIKLSFWEFLKSKMKKKRALSKRSQIVLQSIKQMKKSLDISGLINRMWDVEKLKLTINNNEFDVLKGQKPKIMLNETDFKSTPYKNEKEKLFHQNFMVKSKTKSNMTEPKHFESITIKNNEDENRNEMNKFNLGQSQSLTYLKPIENSKITTQRFSKFIRYSSESIHEKNNEDANEEKESDFQKVSDEIGAIEINISKKPDLFNNKNF